MKLVEKPKKQSKKYNSKTNKKHKKNKKSKKILGYKINELENYDLIHDPKKLAKYVSYDKCKKKTGYLGYIQDRPSTGDRKITVFPVFVSLNKHTLSVFKSFEPASLFQVVNLDVIQRVTLEYKNTFCFDIIINRIHRNQFTSGPLTLCAKSLNEMRDWINAVLEFKECKIKVKNDDHNGKILVDFNKMNEHVKKKGALGKFNLENLKYQGTDKAFKDTKSKAAHRMKIDYEMKSILETITQSNIAKNQMKRQFTGKLLSAGGLQQGIFNNEDMMKSLMERKKIVSMEQENSMLRNEHTMREYRILRNIRRKITILKVLVNNQF